MQTAKDQHLIRAEKYAVRLLSTREYSEKQLKTKLRQKGFESKSIEACIEKMHHWDYLDDQRFARAFVRKLLKENYAETYIIMKVKEAGVSIDSDLVEQQYLELNLSVHTQIITILQKRFIPKSQMEEEKKAKYRNKALRYLQSRGFSYHQIRELFQDHFDEIQ